VLCVSLLAVGWLSNWSGSWLSMVVISGLLISFHLRQRKETESLLLKKFAVAEEALEKTKAAAAIPKIDPAFSQSETLSATELLPQPEQINVDEVRSQVRDEVEAQLDLSFAAFFQRKTSESWGVLVRNSKDGGANSVLAAHVIRKTMGQLSHASKQVTEMLQSTEGVAKSVELLTSISDGIRLLSEQSKFVSLNANIEAQRAGEHGKVFAVIAAGLGKLATDIRQMTEKTEGILKQVNEDMKTNKALCQRVARIFDGVDEELKQFNKLMMRIEELAQSQTQSFGKFENEMVGISKKHIRQSQSANEWRAS